MRRGSAVRHHKERLAWVLAHPELMAGVPSMADDVDEAGRAKLDALEAALLAEGLVVGTRMVRRETVRRLVGEIRTGKSAPVYW